MLKFRDNTETGKEMVITNGDGAILARIPPSIRDQMRYLWTRLQVHDGEVPRSIAVTSQLSGEGVSFTSRALAATLARTSPTCLVEANWWGAGLPIGEPNEGLAAVMKGTATVEEVLVRTNHVGLWILPAGDLQVSGQAVMANTEAMATVLETLKTGFGHVIVDLPAITTSATALTFAAATDASLLVVRQRVTRIDQVEKAVEDLRHTRLLGVILNGSRVYVPKFLRRRLFDS